MIVAQAFFNISVVLVQDRSLFMTLGQRRRAAEISGNRRSRTANVAVGIISSLAAKKQHLASDIN
jgi:hypothetical protein